MSAELRAMTEMVFYQLNGQSLEQVLPPLVQKSLERGWRVIVQASSDERIEALDVHLWTWRADAFLPHGTWRDAQAYDQPVLLTLDEENPNGAAVRFLVEDADFTRDLSAYERVVVIVDGGDEAALEKAKGRLADARATGFQVTYWLSDQNGRWQRQA